ncbi:hypothetical protein, partial [Nocardia cyriacigeorgica]|uniref:hypothetical protein n=1 Tax=Nocardia cyriacigeorgica TaxID=135487 RepID=UPI0024541D81
MSASPIGVWAAPHPPPRHRLPPAIPLRAPPGRIADARTQQQVHGARITGQIAQPGIGTLRFTQPFHRGAHQLRITVQWNG